MTTRYRKKANPLWSLVYVGLFLALWAGSCLMGAAVEPETAERALVAQGFSDIQIQDKVIFLPALRGCGRGDATLFRARAKNPVGQEVSVIVCVGWPFKSSTVRIP